METDGQYLQVTATHPDGEGSGKRAEAVAANAVTGTSVNTYIEILAGGLMGPVTWMGAWTSDCASEARRGSYAGYYTFELYRRKQAEINLTSAVDLCRVRRQGKGRAQGRASPREPELRDHCDPGGWDPHRRGYDTVEATTFLAQTGDFTLSVRPQECSEDRGMLRAGGC